VLDIATRANVTLNTRLHVTAPGTPVATPPAYVSGDFASACDLLLLRPGFRPFDFLLTTETIYNRHSAGQLLDGAAACLAQEGVILLAAKSYYFGVGGGIAAFKQQVKQHGVFRVAEVVRISDEQGNVREILKLVRKPVPSVQ
jgi:hypothetical protein